MSSNNKILACSYSPYLDDIFPINGLINLKSINYDKFEKRVLKILSMTQEEYFSQLGKEKSFIMAPIVDAADILRKKISNYF